MDLGVVSLPSLTVIPRYGTVVEDIGRVGTPVDSGRGKTSTPDFEIPNPLN